ncbi:MAG: MmgE/PrpD family protein [Betaproteobacteria bacterium]|nr:MmgE/PrpD family protein [Betaproteobacteria bacterium]
MTVAAELAQRIVAMRYEDLPPEAVQWAKVSIIDTIGCALAAVDEDAPRIAERVLTGGSYDGPSLVWGTRKRARVLDAAVINGTAAHALDYDDVGGSIGGHPSIPILPGIVALGEALGVSGRDLVAAFIAGWETEARIGHAVNMHHYEKGWHPTATLGVFGGTAGAAKLLGLDAERTATALAIAVSLAAGVKSNFGSMTKPLHAGQSTRHGVYAAMLAKEGFTAQAEAFEHPQGFFEVFNGAGSYDPGRIFERWADPLDILDPGVGLKQYPCCASTHSAIDATLLLREKHGLTPERIAKIESITHARALAHTNRPDPKSTLDAKFSVQYCIARALLHGEVTFAHFEGESYRDPQVRALLSRIEARPHAHQPKGQGMEEHFECDLNVTTRDGKRLSAHVDQPLRGPKNLTPPDRLRAKFHDCAARALHADAVGRVYEAIGRIETCADLRDLTRLLADSAKSAERKQAAA